MTETPFPTRLHDLAKVSVGFGVMCCLLVTIDELATSRRRSSMQVVWPVCALFGSAALVAFYLRRGRPATDPKVRRPDGRLVVATLNAGHCGAACTLSDIAVGGIAYVLWDGRGSAGSSVFTGQTVLPEFLLAFAVSLTLHSAPRVPSRHSLRTGVLQAVCANALTIAACQAAMYLAMLALKDLWLMPAFDSMGNSGQPEYWFVMQIAMIVGYAATIPVNVLLLRRESVSDLETADASAENLASRP